jgi:predicted nucleic acid-binding protein
MLFDTCVVIDVLRKQKLAMVYLAAMPTLPAVSVVTVAELYAGARGSRDERNIANLLSSARLLPVTEDIARRAGEWLKHYRGSHGVDDFDALIAATAEHHGLPLATLNLKHFPMFPKLKAAY